GEAGACGYFTEGDAVNMFWIIKIELFVIVFLISAFLAAAFIIWENPFRHISPLFAIRVLIASVVVVWLICFALF
ncbi:hypothetical protein NVA44_004815, partial [Escherichia coli]|nr:hypothetical protein [Escherichia coli]